MGIIMYKDTPYGVNNPDFLAPTPLIYSEDEEQCGIWVDGKPLYKKTKVVSINLHDGVYQEALTSFASNIEALVKLEGTFYSSNFIMPIPRIFLNPTTNQNYGYSLYVTNSNITLLVGADTTLNGTFAYTGLYTKSTDTAYQGGFKAYGFTPVIYSDDEREIGVWRDGKPLYQKTIPCQISSSANSVSIQHGISNLDKTVDIKAVVRESTVSKNVPNVYNTSMDFYSLSVYSVNATNFSIVYGDWGKSVASTAIVYVTLQYTKTTDTAGSGKYTTLGTPAVHYSTDEQVIGTWVDGKTLYQKTISCGALPNSTDKRVSHNISNLDYVVEAKGWAQAPGVNSTSVMFPNNSTAGQVTLIIDPSDIIIRTMQDRSTYTKTYVTIQYTKTT